MWRFVSSGGGTSNAHLTTLNHHHGRQTWEYIADAGTDEDRQRVEELKKAFADNRHSQKHSSDELLRLQVQDEIKRAKYRPPATGNDEGVLPDEGQVAEHLLGAVSFYECLQQDEGFFPGDYGGPMFLMPGLIIVLYVTEAMDKVLTIHHKEEMIRYLRNHQNEDGGFGLHIEGHSTMFGTGLNYVAARLLGLGPNDELCSRARTWIHSRGGINMIPSWGKFYLATLGVFSWDGLNPLPPEMWLLPYKWWTGIGYLHPGRYWCHCRMVYLPMSYVYGRRATCPPSPLTSSLKEELYTQPYDTVDWNKARNQCAQEDLYYPHPLVQDVLWWTLYQVEPLLVGSWLRKKALQEVMEHIHYEDENTRYVDIGPVNKVINMLCCWLEDPEGPAFKKHLARVPDYLWMAEDGMKMQGYNGSTLWDTAFTVQALVCTGLGGATAECLRKAHMYVEQSQVVAEAAAPLSKYYRHISQGAWPFSSRDHGWPISDCSSEGLKAALALARLPSSLVGSAISPDRLCQSVDVILSYQNRDGGMATYERTRSFHWLEILNPAETFGDIMVDYSYVECTSACITALCAFRDQFPQYRTDDIQAALKKAEGFVRSTQRADGSWYGSWAVCFTYGTWFGVAALQALGYTYKGDEAIRKACAFILKKQRLDGGWGESYLSSQDKVYVHKEGDSHVVNTAWAMLTLMIGGYHEVNAKPLHQGAMFLMKMQESSGDWPQQTISGVFNRNCMITYANYRNLFPIWALGMYRRLVLQGETDLHGWQSWNKGVEGSSSMEGSAGGQQNGTIS